MGSLVDRTHRELTDEDVAKIASTYHAWCCDEGAGEYVDVAGFCRAAPLVEIRTQGHILTPGRYVGTAAADEDDEPFEERMRRFTVTLFAQQTDAAELDAAISANLTELGYGG
jgi:type I restriction enzyme M protein